MPFMPQYHEGSAPEDGGVDTRRPTPIVAENGKTYQSLYLGAFYVDDPTLVVLDGGLLSTVVR